MSFFADFQKFAFKGNVIDLAVGVVIGGAFGKIVSALVGDIVMPVVALMMPQGDWRQNGWLLRSGGANEDQVVLRYGDLLGATLDFFIVALVLFIVVSKLVRRAERALGNAPPPPTTRPCPQCLENVPLEARRCRACTSSLTSAA